jgi:hypothetical protein
LQGFPIDGLLRRASPVHHAKSVGAPDSRRAMTAIPLFMRNWFGASSPIAADLTVDYF